MATIRYCPHCGTRVQVDAAFCGNCGSRLREGVDPGSGIAPAFENYGQAIATDLRYRVSLNRVLLMTEVVSVF